MFNRKIISSVLASTCITFALFGNNSRTQKSNINGRIEETFSKAKSLQEINPYRSLSLLCQWYTNNTIDIAQNSSEKNLDRKMIAIMNTLLSNLIISGYSSQLVTLFSPKIIIHTNSTELFLKIIHILVKNANYDKALIFIHKVNTHFDYSNKLNKLKIQKITVNIYHKYIKQQIKYNNLEYAESIFNSAKAEFPNNYTINLDGVEIAIKQRNWKKAKQILNLMDYPKQYSYQVQLLMNEIEQLASEVGKIVIKFRPGSNYIPTQGILNGSYTQQFIIDTGSSFVTIPHSTASYLNINIPSNAPIRTVETASGYAKAKEITINSITMKNKTVHNIKALVLDLPGHSDKGLLGLTFLKNFDVSINNQQGIIILSPK